MRYSGAGILFISKREGIDRVLLGCRKMSKRWSIPGGGRKRQVDPWATALRETGEEFGDIPAERELLCAVRFPFILFDWTTFVVRLTTIPDPSVFPNRNAPDFEHEFCDAKWFPIGEPPPKTHTLIYPVIMRLRARAVGTGET